MKWLFNLQTAVQIFYTLIVFSISTVNCFAVKMKDLRVSSTEVQDRKVDLLENDVLRFYKTKQNLNTLSNLKAKLEQLQIQNEQSKYWSSNTLNNMKDSYSKDDVTSVQSELLKTATNPFEVQFKAQMNIAKKDAKSKTQELKEYLAEKETSTSQKHENKRIISSLNSNTISEETVTNNPFLIKMKIRPEKQKASMGVSNGLTSAEADYNLNGKKELSSSQRLKDLGVVMKVTYRIDQKQTITSLDKELAPNLIGRISKVNGLREENKAEVLYQVNF